MKRRLSWGFAVVLSGLLVVIAGCDNASQITKVKVPTDLRDRSITQLHSLSWMGGQSHPITQAFQIVDPDNLDINISPGGIVLADVVDGLPLDNAGMKPGDAIVRVAENWLPIKEDPTLDFIKSVEDQINAQKKEIEIGYLRSGDYAVAKLDADLKSLDQDLPLANPRFIDSSTALLKKLLTMQQVDGSFAGASESNEYRLVVTALCGLAMLSADPSVADEFRQSIGNIPGKSLLDTNGSVGRYVERQLADVEFVRGLNPLSSAYVCSLLAECDLSADQEKWNETLGVLTFVFSDTQHESGGWNVTEPAATAGTDPDADSSDDSESADQEAVESKPQPDVYATFTTNMVLTAIGALERKGVSLARTN